MRLSFDCISGGNKSMKSRKQLGILLLVLGIGVVQAAAAETGGFERNLKVAGSVTVEVTSGSGNITVHVGGNNDVHVVAKIRASTSWFGMSATEKVRRIEKDPPVEQTGSFIRIGRIEDRDLTQNVSIDYDVTVPAQTKLTSSTGSGDQSVRGVQLPLTVKTGSGNITIENVGADTRIRSGSGDLRVNSVKGMLDAQTGSGSIRGFGIAGQVVANTGSGDIEIEQVASGNARIGTGSGSVKLRGIKGGLTVETGSGDIHAEGEPTADWRVGTGSGTIGLRVPAQASFNIDARTSSGRLTVNRPVTMQGSMSKNHIQGKVGNGGVLIDVHTGSGNVQVD
jgi:Putative adhesin